MGEALAIDRLNDAHWYQSSGTATQSNGGRHRHVEGQTVNISRALGLVTGSVA